MSDAPRFGRVLTAMVTPFDADGGLDLDAARDLARWLEAHGNDGLVVAGTTGEAPVLSDDEKLSLWAAVAEAVTSPSSPAPGRTTPRIPSTSTAEASRLGVAGILAVGPYYNRPSQDGLEAALPGRGGGDRPAGDDLRHPDPHRAQDRIGDAAPPGA